MIRSPVSFFRFQFSNIKQHKNSINMSILLESDEKGFFFVSLRHRTPNEFSRDKKASSFQVYAWKNPKWKNFNFSLAGFQWNFLISNANCPHMNRKNGFTVCLCWIFELNNYTSFLFFIPWTYLLWNKKSFQFFLASFKLGHACFLFLVIHISRKYFQELKFKANILDDSTGKPWQKRNK